MCAGVRAHWRPCVRVILKNFPAEERPAEAAAVAAAAPAPAEYKSQLTADVDEDVDRDRNGDGAGAKGNRQGSEKMQQQCLGS